MILKMMIAVTIVKHSMHTNKRSAPYRSVHVGVSLRQCRLGLRLSNTLATPEQFEVYQVFYTTRAKSWSPMVRPSGALDMTARFAL